MTQMTSLYIFGPFKKSKMVSRSNMATILPINDMLKWRFTIVIGIFLYEKNLKMILNMLGQYQLVHFENSVEFI